MTTKATMKKLILSQLAGYLRREVIIDGMNDEADIAIAEAAQDELIAEFTRRSVGCKVEERWDTPRNG